MGGMLFAGLWGLILSGAFFLVVAHGLSLSGPPSSAEARETRRSFYGSPLLGRMRRVVSNCEHGKGKFWRGTVLVLHCTPHQR